MISLARQLAWRREIEEEQAELAGRLGRRDCHGPIPDARSTQRKRCDPCRAKNKSRLACERGR